MAYVIIKLSRYKDINTLLEKQSGFFILIHGYTYVQYTHVAVCCNNNHGA